MTTQSRSYNADLLSADAEALGWSGASLARQAKVAQAVVSRFFRGGRIRPETLKKLADAVGYDTTRYIRSPRVRSDASDRAPRRPMLAGR